MSDGPEISVIIPALGNLEILRRVLAGYEDQRVVPGCFEVIVVRDPADPDPAALRGAVGDRAYPVRVLEGIVPGASGSRNFGWRSAAAPLVLFTDCDTVPVPGLIEQHLAWHRQNPEPEVVVVGLVRWAEGIHVTPFMRWLEQGMQFDFGAIRGAEASWAHVYSSNCSVKRRFLDLVGGYDEGRLPFGYEDLDWGYRAREHGLRVLLNRAAAVDHWRTVTVEDWQARAPRLAVSEWRFCESHPEVAPWFQRVFSEATEHPPAGRHWEILARYLGPQIPWLGEWIWSQATLHWRQQIAPYFLGTWDALRSGADPGLIPGLSDRVEPVASPPPREASRARSAGPANLGRS